MHRLFWTVPVMLLAAATTARADVCIAVDEAHDTFTAANRASAVLLAARQFELAGEHIVADGCPNRYLLSHVSLGKTIFVTIVGPGGRREGTALGMDDLPALYNQMARSLMTGRPMSGFNVVDRTNVTAAQASTERVAGDSLWYARLGYGATFGDTAYGAPAIGFGYRYELDSFGVDVSFFNFQQKSSHAYVYPATSNGSFVGSILKLEGLYFVNGRANATPYFGGGLSWGGTDFGSGWNGNGLHGELTAGYEMVRASTLRMFVQADATMPFYEVTAVRYPRNYRPGATVTVEHRYAPSLSLSLGLGWGRDRHRRR